MSRRFAAAILDLDQTLVDSAIASTARSARKWSAVYPLIPSFTLYDGVPEVMDALHQMDVRVAIVTNSPRAYAARVLAHFEITPSEIVAWHDTIEHKPAPTPYFEAMRRLGASAAQTVAVGDAPDDITAARRAGIASIGALWGTTFPHDALSHATYLCRTPLDILAIMLS